MDRLNKWLTLSANFGVLIGIGFLAYEVNVNTNSLNAATAAQMSSNWNDITVAVMTDPALVPLMLKANEEGWPTLPPDEQLRIGILANTMLKAAEFAYLRFLDGSLSPSEWTTNDRTTRGFMVFNPFVGDVWRLGRFQYSGIKGQWSW